MATTLQIRRGNTDDNNRFKGALGEITLDTQLWQLRAHDNVTVGGHVVGGGVSAPVQLPSISITNTTGLTFTKSVLGNDIVYTAGGVLSTGYGGTGSVNPLMTSTSPLAITGTWPNVNIAITGNISVDHGGTGLTTTPGQNQILLGDGSKYNLTTLVPGSGITFDQSQNGILTIRGGGGSGNTITLADLPPGTVQYFAMQAAPDGWLECNGATLNKTAYNNLYLPLWQAIGYQYGGSGDSFNLPDLRGQFIRGWDHGRGVDPNRLFGNTQPATSIRVLVDNYTYPTGTLYDPMAPAIGAKNIDGFESGAGSDTQTSGYNTNYWTVPGTLTTGIGDNFRFKVRPTNVALLPCIKYKPGTQQPLLSSVDVSGGTTGLVFSGGPITSSGVITASGTLAPTNGGTGINVPNPSWHYTYGTAGAGDTPLIVDGAGHAMLIKFNNQIVRQGVNYDPNTGDFTITVAGIYHLYAQVQYISLVSNYHGLSIVKNGATVTEGYNQIVQGANQTFGQTSTVYCSITIPLAVGDNVHVSYNYNLASSNGTGAQYLQTNWPNRNYFGGYRVG